MKCPQCFEKGIANCNHRPVGTSPLLAAPYGQVALENRTVSVKVLAYMPKKGGRLTLVPEGLHQPPLEEYIRMPKLDQVAEMPNPQDETKALLLKCIDRCFNEDHMTRNLSVADGAYPALIKVENGKITVS